jgi:hypothetical protein
MARIKMNAMMIFMLLSFGKNNFLYYKWHPPIR